MTFNITAVEGSSYDDGLPRCEIEMNGYLENCPLTTDLWSLDDYRHQWKIALSHLYQGKVKKCMLVTDINKIKINTAITYWALHSSGNFIFIRESLKRNPGLDNVLDPVLAEAFINGRDGDDPDDLYPVSEWKIKFEDIAHLVK